MTIEAATQRAVRTPLAAAVAGLVFSILILAVFTLLRLCFDRFGITFRFGLEQAAWELYSHLFRLSVMPGARELFDHLAAAHKDRITLGVLSNTIGPADFVRRILAHLATLLTDDGHLHALELVLPERPSVSRQLARYDRGEYPRPLAEWRELFGESLEPVVFEPYPLVGLGVKLWDMVYFKGRARR